MIKRDSYDIIVQHDPNQPTYSDGGDSASRTGIMAMCGSIQDQVLLREFDLEFNGHLKRHPFQEPYNDYRSFTRDQLLPFMAGAYRANKQLLTFHVFYFYFKRFFICANTITDQGKPKKWWDRDLLSPSHIGHLIICSKMYILYPFLLFSYLDIFIDILWACFVAPKDESNQILSMLDVYGTFYLRIYCKLHPDWKNTVSDYWGYWRDQKEIGDALIKYIENRLK